MSLTRILAVLVLLSGLPVMHLIAVVEGSFYELGVGRRLVGSYSFDDFSDLEHFVLHALGRARCVEKK